MATFMKGDVVVVPFPFSDLSSSKRRPALVLADLPGGDIILCQITSQFARDISAVSLTNADFISGVLQVDSNVRPNKLFTADKAIIAYKVGTISAGKYNDVYEQIRLLLAP